ncbi:TPA: YadA-like family protein [Salmonella enterica subsp. enterica serovar Newport]
MKKTVLAVFVAMTAVSAAHAAVSIQQPGANQDVQVRLEQVRSHYIADQNFKANSSDLLAAIPEYRNQRADMLHNAAIQSARAGNQDKARHYLQMEKDERSLIPVSVYAAPAPAPSTKPVRAEDQPEPAVSVAKEQHRQNAIASNAAAKAAAATIVKADGTSATAIKLAKGVVPVRAETIEPGAHLDAPHHVEIEPGSHLDAPAHNVTVVRAEDQDDTATGHPAQEPADQPTGHPSDEATDTPTPGNEVANRLHNEIGLNGKLIKQQDQTIRAVGTQVLNDQKLIKQNGKDIVAVAEHVASQGEQQHLMSAQIEHNRATGAYAQSRADAAYANTEANREALVNTNKRVSQNSADIANHEQRIQTLESNTNAKFGQLKSEVDQNRKRASAGIAGVAAMANIPQVIQGQTFSVGAGVGNTDGESALAVGMSARASENVVVKASVSNDTQHNFVVGAGVSYGW